MDCVLSALLLQFDKTLFLGGDFLENSHALPCDLRACGLQPRERSRKTSTISSAAPWKDAKLKLASVQAQIAGRPKLAKSRIKHPSIRLSRRHKFSPPMPQLQPELTLRALSYGLIVLLTLFALSLISIRKEYFQGRPINGIIWFTVAIIGSCAVVALLAGYAQKARSLEKVSRSVQTITNPLW
jgi:hypothetical protein